MIATNYVMFGHWSETVWMRCEVCRVEVIADEYGNGGLTLADYIAAAEAHDLTHDSQGSQTEGKL